MAGMAANVATAVAAVGFTTIPFLRSVVPGMHEKKGRAGIIKLLPPNDTPEYPGLSFQYFPETIQDSKQVNYAEKTIPGGNLPLYQWVNGGERTISFSLTFTTDIDRSLGGNVRSQIEGNQLERRNVDIIAALTWLRSFMMPTYVPETRQVLPPPKCLLYVPGTGLPELGGAIPGELSTTSAAYVRCIMRQCEVEIQACFPSNNPRIASVSLQLAQVAQAGGVVRFPGYSPSIESVIKEGFNGYGGYRLSIT